jgi:MoxR-like ATPase
MTAAFEPDLSTPLTLPRQQSWPERKHHFDQRSVWAVRAALAARRPLLLRGEPGIGKSQLARAVAVALEVPFLYQVVDERSERDDLLFHFDAISRLAEAQVSSLLAKEDKHWRERLAEKNYLRPGLLWWAYNWETAAKQAGVFSKACRPCPEPPKPDGWTPRSARPCGPVVLVDEIDKADPTVPNGLLESMGNDGFVSERLDVEVQLAEGTPPPLIMITTNEEGELPAAFLRRCLVLQMHFPSDPKEAERFLIEQRARVNWTEKDVSTKVCQQVVAELLRDREAAREEGMAVPGAAEFIDILRVLVDLHRGDEKAQMHAFAQTRDFALRKNLAEEL